MCLLIVQPKGVTFSRAEIADFVDYNADGFAIAYGDGKALHLTKRVGEAADIYRDYLSLAAGRKCVLHFRMATHGPVSAENSHPYFITPDIAMAHNGILDIGNPVDATKTDSWHFAEFFIKPVAILTPENLFNAQWLGMLGELIGPSNKLTFIHSDGRIAIVNEDTGVSHKRAWMSNTYAWSNRHRPAIVARHETSEDYYDRAWQETVERTSASLAADAEFTDEETGTVRAGTWTVDDKLESATENFMLDGMTGLSYWVHRHPYDAACILAAYYKMTRAQATAQISTDFESALENLKEIIEVEVSADVA